MTIIEELKEAREQRDAECAAKELAQKEVVTLKANIVDLTKLGNEASAKASADAVALVAEQKAHEATKQELTVAKSRLENPAFKAAEALGAKPVADAGVVAADVKVKTCSEWNAEYEKIQDPKAREDFRKEHAKELGLVK